MERKKTIKHQKDQGNIINQMSGTSLPRHGVWAKKTRARKAMPVETPQGSRRQETKSMSRAFDTSLGKTKTEVSKLCLWL